MLNRIRRSVAAGWLALSAAALVLLCGLNCQTAAAQVSSSQPRFTVELKPVAASSLPALHSFSLAVGSDGKWLIIGGRTNGLHAFVQSSNNGTTPPPNAFPVANANRLVWVIDPATGKTWSAPLDGLPVSIADALSATNAESAQEGDTLYIIGGYGWDSQKQQMTTFGMLNAIQVDETIKAVMNKSTLVPLIQQTGTYLDCPQFGVSAYNTCDQDPNTGEPACKQGPGWSDCIKKVQATCRAQRQQAIGACAVCVQNGQTQCAWNGQTSSIPTVTGYYTKVTGGGLEKVGNTYYLVFGQDFEGLYSVLEGDYGKWPIIQTYTEQIAGLQFTSNPLSAAVLNVYQQDPNDLSAPYHRRDLNVLAALAPDGTPRIVAHGGVFVPGQDSAYRQPIFINNGADPMKVTITVDSYQQVMSQYDCAVLKMFDRSSKSAGQMINVFFGGISLYYLDAKTGKLKLDSGLPFINSLTSLTYNADGSWSEYIRRAPLDGLMGTDAKFVPVSSVSAAANGVIYLDAIKGNTLVGYVYGGILASQPKAQAASDTNASYTQSSNALYEVWVNTGATPPTGYWISTPNAATGTATGGKVTGTKLHPASNVLNENVSKPANAPAKPAPPAPPQKGKRPKKKQ
ncbi:MAG: hypothetical protein JOZ52_05050 [Acidobacteria bacterium]|nr:hypothetical protein [Acidobacteriota bacterium]